PDSALNISGPAGGPFPPGGLSYTLTNAGGSSLDWTISKTSDWLDLSATNGTLAVAGSTNVTVLLNTRTEILTVGNYTATVGFTNLTSGAGSTNRFVSLPVTPNYTRELGV